MSNTPGAPVDDQYVALIGRALYNFAYAEWEVIYLGSLLLPAFLNREAGNDSHTIAREFSLLSQVEHFPELIDIANRFAAAEEKRMALLRATPITGPLGAQILEDSGQFPVQQWDLQTVTSFTLELETLATDADALYYKLKSKDDH